jgi:hypothetical protein
MTQYNDVLGPTWLSPGATVQWNYSWGGSQGAAFAQANCQSPDSDLMATSQGEELDENGNVTYFVDIVNQGSEPCFHNLNIGTF